MAVRTISVAGGNWGDTATWDEGAVPTSADDVVVRAGGDSGSVTVTAAAAALTLNLSGGAYSGTFTINSTFTLTVSGSVTLNSSGSCPGPVGAGTLNTIAAANLTSNGKTVACNYSHSPASSSSLTLIDDAVITGQLSWSSSFTPSINGVGRTITVSGGVSTASRAGLGTGCTLKITGGTCTSSIAGTSGYGINGLGTVEFAGNITMSGLFVRTAVMRYTSGTWGTGHTLYMGGNTTIYGAPPIVNLSFRQASGTITLTEPLTITGTLNPFGLTTTFAGAYTITVAALATATLGGVINLGDCTWAVTAASVSAGAFSMALLGASLTVGSLTVSPGATFTFGAGYTLTVSSLLRVDGLPTALSTIQSNTASSAFTLSLGSAAIESERGIYTDVSVAASRTIYNVFGGTLTRTTRIENKDNTTMRGVDPGVANVVGGVTYNINAAARTGTLVVKTSSGG